MAQSADSGRAEQIIKQLHHKAVHAVLGARVPALLRRRRGAQGQQDAATGARRRDRWFNLALADPSQVINDHGVLLHGGVTDPLIIDILLHPLDHAPLSPDSVIERWCVLCEHSSTRTRSPPSPSRHSLSSFYKKSIVLLRSLYSVLRLLPAYRVFRKLTSSHRSYNYDIGYKIDSFMVPFSRSEEENFNNYKFTPVETQFGPLSVTVNYRHNLSEFNLEVSSLLPPMIIPDYVGSPAADPLRSFPTSSASQKGSGPTSYPLRGASESSSRFLARPHSWASGPYYPLSSSPASDCCASPPETNMHQIASRMITSHRRNNIGFDDYRLSPPFSRSPTPSPPMHCNNPLQSRLNSETAPVRIPLPLSGKDQLHHSPNLSDATRSQLPPPSPRSTKMDLSPSEGRSFRKGDGMRLADLYSNLQLFKGLKDPKDDSGRFSGILSSCGSPGFAFSRSSSRLSMQEDIDDADFSCPFAVDDVDSSDSGKRNTEGKDAEEYAHGSTSSSISQEAAVGILVHMLKTAPPLRQDPSYSSHFSKSQMNCDVGSSSFFVSRKASDALEELQSYRAMKDMLLSQSNPELAKHGEGQGR